MRVRSLFMIAVLGLVLVFAGCSSGIDGVKENSLLGGKSGSSMRGGSGVVLSFADSRPSSEMFKGEPTTFAFVFTNYQEHEISDMRVQSRGFDRGYVVGLPEEFSITKIPPYTSSGPGVFAGYVVSGVVVLNPTFPSPLINLLLI